MHNPRSSVCGIGCYPESVRYGETMFFQGFLTGLSIVLLIAGFIMKRKSGGKEETITGK